MTVNLNATAVRTRVKVRVRRFWGNCESTANVTKTRQEISS